MTTPIWLISDTHFGEQPTRRRKLSGMDADQLDQLILANWRSAIGADDTIWHVGDIGKDWRLLGDLPGRKHLILAHASDRRAAIRDSGIFATIQETATITHSGREFHLVHNPDQPRSGPVVDVIHGHHHYRTPEPGHFSVCVDHWNWAPVLLGTLIGA